MRAIYDLSGEWELFLEPDGSFEEALANGVEERVFADTMELPATTAQASKSVAGENTAVETGYLTEVYPFCGNVWFKREIPLDEEDAGQPMQLYLERTRMTALFINGKKVGSCDSICAPHTYTIDAAMTRGVTMLELVICVNNKDYPTRGGHMTSPDTQTNWIGILGQMELRVFEEAEVIGADVITDAATGEIQLTLMTQNTTSEPVAKRISVNAEYITLNEQSAFVTEPLCWKAIRTERGEQAGAGSEVEAELIMMPGVQTQQLTLTVAQPRLFSEFTPGYGKIELYTEDAKSTEVIFGFRDFTTDRHHFYINGKKTYLRGKHDGMVFPLTGAAPMEVEGWLAVMQTAKAYGINHYRFHTCCPPEAAFVAADLLGIYMEPELPFWGTIADKGEEGYNEAEQAYLIQEGFRLMKAFGGHPSFVMMSLGNELWGSRKRLGEILDGFKAVDRRHLYTSGSNNFQFYPSDIPEEEFFAGVRFGYESLIRGSYAMCDAPQGFVQTTQPNTTHSYDGFFDAEESAGEAAGGEIEIQYGTGVKKVKADSQKAFTTNKPILSHEVGQYCTYPDFKEIEKYTGVLRARNFEEFHRRLENAGMAEQAEAFFKDSGALAAFCYKLEIEAAQRSQMLAGYQLLDLQDFPGQGTALVGVLNALMEPKGIISQEEWNHFCAKTVVMAELPRFVYRTGEELTAKLLVAHYDAEPLPKGHLVAELIKKSQEAEPICVADIAISAEAGNNAAENGVVTLGSFCRKITDEEAAQYELLLTLYAGEEAEQRVICQNQYPLYVYPAVAEGTEGCEKAEVLKQLAAERLAVTADATEALKVLKQGGRVLYFPEKTKEGLEGSFCTDFWCYPMFRSISESMNRRVPIGTLGLTIQNQHKALAEFVCDTCSTPQWYGIVTQSESVNLSGTALKPIVQVIDNFERNHKLGLLFEASCCGGSLLVCSSRPWELTQDAAAAAFFASIRAYAVSESFCPKEVLTEAEFTNIFV